jgi:recombination protein RecT
VNEQTPSTQTAGKAITVIDQLRRDLTRMATQFSAVLPAHIPVERFTRVVVTAVQNNQQLLRCNRQSLFNACMKAATDGLLPDGREGAIVPFGDSEDGRKAADTASWMPMVAGIRKKARNSGELSDLYAHVVFDGDEFDIQLGDDPRIRHKPALSGGRTRKIVGAYSIAKFKDGTISHEYMSVDAIEDIRKRFSRAKKGPWSDPISYPEMCRKTVVRLHAKSLPMSTDLDDVLRRDDELYDFKGARERGQDVMKHRPSAAEALAHFGNENADQSDPRPGDGVVIENGDDADADDINHLLEMATKNPPKTPDSFAFLASAVVEAAKKRGGSAGAAWLEDWWKTPESRNMRNGAGMTSEQTNLIVDEIKATAAELRAGGDNAAAS